MSPGWHPDPVYAQPCSSGEMKKKNQQLGVLKGDQVPSKGSLCAKAHVGKGETGWWNQASACFSGCLLLHPPPSGRGVTGRRQKGPGQREGLSTRDRQGWDRHPERSGGRCAAAGV